MLTKLMVPMIHLKNNNDGSLQNYSPFFNLRYGNVLHLFRKEHEKKRYNTSSLFKNQDFKVLVLGSLSSKTTNERLQSLEPWQRLTMIGYT